MNTNGDCKSFKMNRLKYENELWKEGYKRVMGLDEVGRGCLAGPVVAAGVILKPNSKIEGIQDSKEIEEPERIALTEQIKEKALFWTIQHGSVEEIDEHNIYWTSLMAMQKCTDAVDADPDYLLVDGNRYLDTIIPHTCLVKGDNRSASIGAASILAKVYRDNLMRKLHEKFPYYSWNTNVGYPTRQHYEGLSEYGISKYHRQSFNLRTHKKLGASNE